MVESHLLEVEAKLKSDYDGSYKAELIQALEKYRNEFVSAKYDLLPPDEHDVVEGMEGSVTSAISVIKDFNSVKPNPTISSEEIQDDIGVNTIINV